MDDKLLQNEIPLLRRLDRPELIMLWLFGGAFIFFLFMYGIRPINDPDFWWHLKTGEFMVQSGGLLQTDPFTFSGDGVVSVRESNILKGYWLWEITAYGLYSLLGFNGIFLLNFLTIAAMAGVVTLQLWRQKTGTLLAVLLLSLGFYLQCVTYALERPQVISFLFMAMLLVLLARVRDGGQLGWLLPLLMMFWANLHGGYVVGDLVLICFSIGAVIEYRQDLPRLRPLLIWVILGIVASLINPNGALVFGELFNFQNSELIKGVGEYQSTWVVFQKGYRLVWILWLLIGLYAVSLWVSRRLYWPELIIALFLAFFSVSYMRNVGFFSVAMLPAIGFHFHQGFKRREWSLPPFIPLLLIGMCTGFFLWIAINLWQGRQESAAVKSIYPEDAISFMQKSRLQGRMFNSYEYGGYLLWRLAPQIQVFIDGRGMEPKVFDDWRKLTEASTTWVNGRREYEALLDHYAIDYVIQPIYDGDGRIQPLMRSLLNKSEWVPIYLDSMVYILARVTAKNAETISNYGMDKNEFKTRLLLTLNHICQSFPEQVGYQVARAGLLIYMGMYEEASTQIEQIKALSPRDQTLPELQRDLALLLGKRLRQ